MASVVSQLSTSNSDIENLDPISIKTSQRARNRSIFRIINIPRKKFNMSVIRFTSIPLLFVFLVFF